MLNDYKKLLDELAEEIENYEYRPTKASSARIRKLSNQVGKSGLHLRAFLVAVDKK